MADLLIQPDELSRALSSGQKPLVIDLRHRLYEDVALLQRLGGALHRKIGEIVGIPAARPQQVLGIPDTATPLALAAAMASLSTNFPLLYGQPGSEEGAERVRFRLMLSLCRNPLLQFRIAPE